MTTGGTTTMQDETKARANAPVSADRYENHRPGPNGERHPYEPLAALEDHLLEIAGEWVVGPHLNVRVLALCMQGAVFDLPAVSQPGRRRECHSNSARLWGRNPDRYKLAAGYALWGDTWVAHSWVVDGNCIVETTASREKYFGAILEDAVALDRWITTFLMRFHCAPLKMIADRGGWPLIAPYLPPDHVTPPDVRAA
jgi:hypothetical protein